MCICFISSGFGIASSIDDVVADEEGKTRKIKCGTEKGKHQCKNLRTACNLDNIIGIFSKTEK